MKTRKLNSIEVSEVGMGCMAFSHGYGQIPPEQYSIEAIRNACGHGCTFFDTAEVYSPNLSGIGHNERIVGKALNDVRNIEVAMKAVKKYGGIVEAGILGEAADKAPIVDAVELEGKAQFKALGQ